MLDDQRSKASFDREDLCAIIYGGREKAEEFKKRQQKFEEHEVLKFDPINIQRSRKDVMDVYAKKLLKYTELFPQTMLMHHEKALFFPEQVPLSLHDYMFTTTLQNLCSDKQVKTILEPAAKGEILGCYAQTELGHGSDVQSLMTTATYDEKTETFIMNTPSVKATKWWIGDLGVYANHAAVFAQLITKGKKRGIHAFLVPIRDSNHKCFEGIEAGDVGPKLGYNNKDNGYLIMTNYRIPRQYMLMKYHKVDREGNYTTRGNEKISYATMLMTRAVIPVANFYLLSKAIVIIVRYSLVRKQFKNKKGEEMPVLDYQIQQEKVFPRIAETFANLFGYQELNELANFVFSEAKNRSNFDRLNEAHTLTSGFKALATKDALKALQTIRRAAGGHGYSMFSALPLIQTEITPTYTFEGQYSILHLQVARFLLKCLNNIQKGKKLPNTFAYLEQIKSNCDFKLQSEDERLVSNPQYLRKIFLYNSCMRTRKAGEKLQKGIQEGLDPKEAWDHYATLQLIEASIAHSYYWIFQNFYEKAMVNAKNQSIRIILFRLLSIYGIEKIFEYQMQFFESGVISGKTLKALNKARERLFAQIRPDALMIVDSFHYSDNTLSSAIGRYDGKVYETLMDWSKNHNQINKPEIMKQIHQELLEMKKLMKPKL